MNEQFFIFSWKWRSKDNPRTWDEIPASHAKRRLTMSEGIAVTNALLLLWEVDQVLMKADHSQFLYTEKSTRLYNREAHP